MTRFLFWSPISSTAKYILLSSAASVYLLKLVPFSLFDSATTVGMLYFKWWVRDKERILIWVNTWVRRKEVAFKLIVLAILDILPNYKEKWKLNLRTEIFKTKQFYQPFASHVCTGGPKDMCHYQSRWLKSISSLKETYALHNKTNLKLTISKKEK